MFIWVKNVLINSPGLFNVNFSNMFEGPLTKNFIESMLLHNYILSDSLKLSFLI
jgi:hypothetical protein